jgi:signal transduction histidine kinase
VSASAIDRPGAKLRVRQGSPDAGYRTGGRLDQDEAGSRLAGELPAPGSGTASGEAVEAAQRLRGTCHDMRQPVAGVFALAAAALAEPGLPGKVRRRLEQIVEQAQWLADMLQQYLSVGEPAEIGSRLFDLASLAAEAAAAERVTYEGELDVVLAGDEPVPARGDRVDIRRIIANLLSNATRAAGPQGTVRIEVGYDEGRALLCVNDSGPGFGRIQEGAGLGLREVTRSVDRCAGRIEYGCGPFGGVRVRLWLPLLAGWTSRSRSDATGSL